MPNGPERSSATRATDVLVVSSEKAPNSVYFVSSEGSVQAEVYDPSPELAMKLALSGKVEPAG